MCFNLLFIQFDVRWCFINFIDSYGYCGLQLLSLFEFFGFVVEGILDRGWLQDLVQFLVYRGMGQNEYSVYKVGLIDFIWGFFWRVSLFFVLFIRLFLERWGLGLYFYQVEFFKERFVFWVFDRGDQDQREYMGQFYQEYYFLSFIFIRFVCVSDVFEVEFQVLF